jgi:hypothetical protein
VRERLKSLVNLRFCDVCGSACVGGGVLRAVLCVFFFGKTQYSRFPSFRAVPPGPISSSELYSVASNWPLLIPVHVKT